MVTSKSACHMTAPTSDWGPVKETARLQGVWSTDHCRLSHPDIAENVDTDKDKNIFIANWPFAQRKEYTLKRGKTYSDLTSLKSFTRYINCT